MFSSRFSSKRFFLTSLFVLAVGVTVFVSRSNQSDDSGMKSAEDYWTETGLSPDSLEDLIQDQICASSERYFLACANAVLNVANRYNLSLATNGELQPAHNVLSDISSEKKQLEPWRELFSHQTAKAVAMSFSKAWSELKAQHIQKNQLSMMVGLALNGFISVFRDPHTYLMPVEHFREVISKTDNHSSSLGLVLGRLNGHYVVRKVVEGSPSEKSGLKKGDLLVSIERQKLSGLLQARVSELLKGELGSTTHLLISRQGKRIQISLKRTESTVMTVSGRILDGIKPVGVLTLNKFAKGACEKAKLAIERMKKSDIRGLLLDLRDNPGGQMEEAACVASLFVGPDQKVFELRYLDPAKKAEAYYGGEASVFDGPIAVLVNGSSASAAEIVAGALQDLNRAVLVGEKTFGKGSFQEGEFWTQNKKIALFETKGFYYLPSGMSPQLRGLTPDVPVHFDHIQVGREADQFLNPLKAPEAVAKKITPRLVANDCLRVEDGSVEIDQEIKTAREILFCAKTVAGTNQ